ncbi:MAG: biotin/lipoyl-binding protein [Peptococcaceae bacterium]|nr:biotin/lipoyl-binding protein [Peptococcaceae bacterium]
MKKFRVTVNGQSFEVEVEEVRGGVPTVRSVAPAFMPPAAPAPGGYAPAPPVAPPPAVKPAAPSPAGAGAVTAPMPGVVNSVKVKEGDEIKMGDVLLVLEAMKMENEIQAPVSGRVKQIPVSAGQSVNAGETLVVIG